MRGTPIIAHHSPLQRRFIPAGAGNTNIQPGRWTCISVHPRGCGEHLNLAAANSWRSGSSPRVRGTLFLVAVDLSSTRFIPAGAGTTRKTPRYCYPGSVHPRGCGEHTATAHRRICRAGSSPRVRGTHKKGQQEPAHERFIPAGAGNTKWRQACTRSATVHPRGCGEHQPSGEKQPCKDGSSPRVRGTLQTLFVLRCSPRFIPAGAGNTRRALVRTR